MRVMRLDDVAEQFRKVTEFGTSFANTLYVRANLVCIS